MFQVDETISSRAEQLFREQQERVYRDTDRLFATLLFWQWLGTIVLAFVLSPFTWEGQERAIRSTSLRNQAYRSYSPATTGTSKALACCASCRIRTCAERGFLSVSLAVSPPLL